MRKYLAAAATALTLSVISLSTPAFADHNGYGGNNQNNQYQNEQYRNDRGRDFDRRTDFDRHEGNFDRWERGWGQQGFHQFRHHRPLTQWQLVRRLEVQGYYGVRGLRAGRFGQDWRAFAFNHRGRPVMLRINPYTGRVLDVRYV